MMAVTWLLIAWFALSLPAGIAIGKLLRRRFGEAEEICETPDDWGDAR